MSGRATSYHMVVLHLHVSLPAPVLTVAVHTGIVSKPCRFQSIDRVAVRAVLSQATLVV